MSFMTAGAINPANTSQHGREKCIWLITEELMGVYFCGSGCCERICSDMHVCGGEMKNTGFAHLSWQKPFTGLLNTKQEETEEQKQKKNGWGERGLITSVVSLSDAFLGLFYLCRKEAHVKILKTDDEEETDGQGTRRSTC